MSTFTYTGIGDEAGSLLTQQIKALQALNWKHIELRNFEIEGMEGGNVHDMPEATFEKGLELLAEANISICGFGSAIGNWAHSILDPFDITIQEIERCIPRMQKAGATLVRVMSYAILQDENGQDLPDQQAAERFQRLREITQRFADAGITAIHENCMNYGGMSIDHALELLEAVPGLRWVYDTGNPVFNEDRKNPGHPQDSWAFYQAMKPYIDHIHIKDAKPNPAKKDCDFVMPGLGDGKIPEILQDLIKDKYRGFVSIEPHIASVYHDTADQSGQSDQRSPEEKAQEQYQSFVDYGKALETLV